MKSERNWILISDGPIQKKRTTSRPERRKKIVRMGDEPENRTGQVIVELLMTSAYAASLAFFHKAIDIVSQKGMEQGVSKSYMEIPTKTTSASTKSRSAPVRHNASDDEVFDFYSS